MDRLESDKIKDEFLKELEYLKVVYEDRNNVSLSYDINNFKVSEKVKDDTGTNQ